jgi:integrase
VHDINDRANIGLHIVAEDLGLPFITMAQARHTFATWSLEKGRSLADIQSDMGHANVATTQGYINTLRTISMIQCKELKEQLLKEVI